MVYSILKATAPRRLRLRDSTESVQCTEARGHVFFSAWSFCSRPRTHLASSRFNAGLLCDYRGHQCIYIYFTMTDYILFLKTLKYVYPRQPFTLLIF